MENIRVKLETCIELKNSNMNNPEDWDKFLRIITCSAPARLIARAMNAEGYYIPLVEGEVLQNGELWYFLELYDEWSRAYKTPIIYTMNRRKMPKCYTKKHPFQKEDVYTMIQWLKDHCII